MCNNKYNNLCNSKDNTKILQTKMSKTACSLYNILVCGTDKLVSYIQNIKESACVQEHIIS